MPCTPFDIPGVGRGIICSRTRTPRCGCGRPSAFQCDAPSKRKSGTCDKHLCASCATEVGPDRHLCQAHASGFAVTNEAPKTDTAPVQQGLF
jgi:hypothetical protein